MVQKFHFWLHTPKNWCQHTHAHGSLCTTAETRSNGDVHRLNEHKVLGPVSGQAARPQTPVGVPALQMSAPGLMLPLMHSRKQQGRPPLGPWLPYRHCGQWSEWSVWACFLLMKHSTLASTQETTTEPYVRTFNIHSWLKPSGIGRMYVSVKRGHIWPAQS